MNNAEVERKSMSLSLGRCSRGMVRLIGAIGSICFKLHKSEVWELRAELHVVSSKFMQVTVVQREEMQRAVMQRICFA